MTTPSIDLDRLLKLRIIVARFGEMDLARWWNTKGQLGPLGAAAVRRGFPRTHHFARARAVFAVAAHRCKEVFDPPGCVTLWHLFEELEEEFDARWERWLDHASEWRPFFETIEGLQGIDLLAAIRIRGILGDRDEEAFSRLRRSAEGRASTGITPLRRYYGAVRPSPAHRYFRPRGWSCRFRSIADSHSDEQY
jgi:hypothetical protein